MNMCLISRDNLLKKTSTTSRVVPVWSSVSSVHKNLKFQVGISCYSSWWFQVSTHLKNMLVKMESVDMFCGSEGLSARYLRCEGRRFFRRNSVKTLPVGLSPFFSAAWPKSQRRKMTDDETSACLVVPSNVGGRSHCSRAMSAFGNCSGTALLVDHLALSI